MILRARLAICAAIACCLCLSVARADMLSASDRRAYRDAFAAAKSDKWPLAMHDAARAHDPLLRKVLHWLELKSVADGGSFADIASFLEENPEWPGQRRLRQRAEQELDGVPDAVLERWFHRFPPITADGKLRQADLLIAAGQRAAGIAEIRDVWVNAQLSERDEKNILHRYPHVIRTEDDVARLDRLVWDGLDASAHRMMRRVPRDYRLLADARLKLADAKPGVDAAVARVPDHLLRDPGLLFERMRWRRRKELYDSATEILLHPPRNLTHPERWWPERQALARHALATGKPKLAYRLVVDNDLTDGRPHAEAEFLAGWVALRFLHDPHAAYEHFLALYNSVRLPISLARGAYWTARAAEKLEQPKLANDWFATAARHATTYYGQLAMGRLGEKQHLPPEPKPSAAEEAAFHKRELVRVVEMLAEIGADDPIDAFVERLCELSRTPDDYALVARLTDAINRSDLTIAVAKRAAYAGVPLVDHGYPLRKVPGSHTVERPLLLAMTRQESAFDRDAVSSAGARGLMQLMPATAKHVARSRGIRYSASRLLTDAHYNMLLGRAYVEDLLARFDGSYVLAIAAYNAGPARVQDWMQQFGDPRTKSTDVIDWIESIPFGETRNYVQRVLENLQIYRLRLGERSETLSLVSDLGR